MRTLLFLGAVLLAGCQGTPIGDAMIGPERLAAMDDEYCQSIGAAPNTDAYIQCRMFRTAQREEGHRQAFRQAGAGISGAGQSYSRSMSQSAAANRPVNCRSVRAVDGSVHTQCQ